MGALQYSSLQDQIFSLLLTESVSLCMLLQILIGMPLNTFCVTFRVQQHMTYILFIAILLCYMVLQMQTGNVDDCKSMDDYLVFFVTKYVEVDYYFIQDMVKKNNSDSFYFLWASAYRYLH